MENSYRRSNICSVLFYFWNCKYILKSASNNQVLEADLIKMKEEDDTSNLVSNLARSWAIELQQIKPSYMRAFHRSFLSRFLLYTILGVSPF